MTDPNQAPTTRTFPRLYNPDRYEELGAIPQAAALFEPPPSGDEVTTNPLFRRRYVVMLNGIGDDLPVGLFDHPQEAVLLAREVRDNPDEFADAYFRAVDPDEANRLVRFASRLGLLARNTKTNKYERVKDKNTFQDCIGAEVVIEVAHREYEKKDKSKGKAANVTFGGIWTVDDKEVKDVPKAKAGTKPPPAPQPKKVDTKGI